MKKIASLVVSGMLMLSMVGCGQYKYDEELVFIGQVIFKDKKEETTFGRAVEELIIDTNEGKEEVYDVSVCTGETFKDTQGNIRTVKSEGVIFSLNKSTREDKKIDFEHMQYGILMQMNCDLNELQQEFIEKYQYEDINEKLYNDVIQMYNDYIQATNDLIQNYDGTLSEDELNQIKFYNEHMENMIGTFAKEYYDKILNY